MKKLLAILIILGFISSCSNPASNVSVSTPAATNTQIATITPRVEFTATPTTHIYHDQDCWQIKPLQDKRSPSGSLVYHNISNKKDYVYYWNIASSESFPIEIDTNLDILVDRIVSPDGKSIARLSEDGLAILSTGKIEYFPVPEGVFISGYLPNGKILLIKHRWDDKQQYSKGNDFTDTFYTLDPLTGKIEEHSVSLPMLQTTSHGYFAINYSPDLHYVIYKSNHNQSNNFNTELTLFDIEKKKIVWVGPPNVPNMVGSDSMIPGWSSDSNSLTYIYQSQDGNYSNYYSISLEGKVTPLTDFTDITVNSWGHGWVTYSEWSPDGRYLIFFSDKNPANTDKPWIYELYILDNKNKTIYKTCIPYEGMGNNSQFPDWYFDGSQFIINFTAYDYSGESEMPKVISSTDLIFDIPNKTIYELPHVDKIDNFISSFGFPPAEFLGWVAWEKP